MKKEREAIGFMYRLSGVEIMLSIVQLCDPEAQAVTAKWLLEGLSMGDQIKMVKLIENPKSIFINRTGYD